MKTGIELITEERKRQIEVEGYLLENDMVYSEGELASAAICYAMTHEQRNVNSDFVGTPKLWPWRKEFWKPTPELRIKELQKSGALIAAEIDRLNELNKRI